MDVAITIKKIINAPELVNVAIIKGKRVYAGWKNQRENIEIMDFEEYKKLMDKVKDKDCRKGCDNCNGKLICSKLRRLNMFGRNPFK